MKFFDGMEGIIQKNSTMIGFFLSINTIRREIYQHGLCVIFIYQSKLNCLSLLFTTLTSNKIISSLRESFMP